LNAAANVGAELTREQPFTPPIEGREPSESCGPIAASSQGTPKQSRIRITFGSSEKEFLPESTTAFDTAAKWLSGKGVIVGRSVLLWLYRRTSIDRDLNCGVR
jgi:hypothetical protein